MPTFSAYHWPGNIRELENIVERVLVYCTATKEINDRSIPHLLTQLAPELFSIAENKSATTLVENEIQLVNQAMIKFNGNKELVAEYLGMSQTTLWRRLKRINENNQRGNKHA
jgi:propionate catabolism operon transcriptional regulator